MTQKTALITGANRGLGLEIGRQLGNRGMRILLGARDAAAGRAAAESLAGEGITAHFVPLDITDEGSVAEAAAFVTREFGVLDILVNNAAAQRMEGQLPTEISGGLLQHLLHTNFIAQVAVTQAFLPLLRQSPAGRIVNMSSSLGSVTVMNEPNHVNVRRNYLGYSASKAALNMYTVLLAKELKGSNIKVNSADPGWTRTELGGKEATQSVEEGARVAVWLSCIGEDGPTGGFFAWQKVNPW